jgi:hypothetical protein
VKTSIAATTNPPPKTYTFDEMSERPGLYQSTTRYNQFRYFFVAFIGSPLVILHPRHAAGGEGLYPCRREDWGAELFIETNDTLTITVSN